MPSQQPPFGFIPPTFDGEISNYTPSLRDSAAYWLAKNWYGDNREGVEKAKRLTNVMEYTPFGFATMADDVTRDAGRGDYMGAGIQLAMAGIPGPPMKGVRGFKGMHPYTDAGDLVDLSKGRGQQSWKSEIPHAGFYASNPDVANHFADALTRNGAVFPVALDFKKPLVIDGEGKHASEFQFGKAKEEWDSYFTSPEYADYDGVILQNVKDAGGITDIYIPKSGDQIRHSLK